MRLQKYLSIITIVIITINSLFSQTTEKCGTFSVENLQKSTLGCENRPIYYTTEYTIETTNFIVHYALISEEISNYTGKKNYTNNFIPPSDGTTHGFAEKVASAAQASWNFQINHLGWQAPPPDGSCGGGNDKYDIYIKSLLFFGETTPETEVPGTNKYSSFIKITPMIKLNEEDDFRPLTDDEIKITIAHEFNHSLQFGYNGNKPNSDNSWFFENTATWMEEIQHPEIDDWIYFFINNSNNSTPLNKPYLPIDYTSGQYSYAGALFCHTLSKWKGNSIINLIWQHAGNSLLNFLYDIDYVLNQHQTSLNEALQRYAIWRFYTGNNDDGNHFDKADKMEGLKILREHDNGIGSGNSLPDNLHSRGGTSYVIFKNADSALDIEFNGYDNTEYSVVALNERVYFANINQTFPLNSNNDGTLYDLSCIGEDYIILIPVAVEWQNADYNLSYIYNSTIGTGISTSFWTEKGNTNITEGTLTLQRSTQLFSGSSKNLSNQYLFRTKTNDERFQNFQDKSIKHINWNSISNAYLLSNDFIARQENNRQSAKYEFLENAKIEVRIEGELIPNLGYGSFQDPWYLLNNGSQPGSFWINFLSKYEPTGKEGETNGGVFLNQGDLNNLVPPYYSVSISPTQTINYNNRSHKIYFNNWSHNGKANFQDAELSTTPVVFTDSGAEVYANHKGSLLSNTQYAFNGPSQRKIARTSDGYYHLVYESMARVWYEEKSTNYNY